MSISRVKSAGWALNEKLTSVQMSQVDANASFALDKRSGQTDTLASAVTVSGAVTFTGTFAVNNILSSFSGIVSLTGPVVMSSTVTLQGAVTFQGSTTVIFQSDPILQTSNLIWNHVGGATDVSIKHVDLTTNGATANDTYLIGQNATGTTSTGGNLLLKAGSGTQLNGVVALYTGAVNVAGFGQNSIALYKRTAFYGTVSLNLLSPAFGTPNVTMDFSTANHFFIGAATADTFLVPTNPINGAIYTVSYLQDGTGGHNIGWGGGYTYHFGSLTLTPDATASKRTTWVFLYNTDFYCLARNVF